MTHPTWCCGHPADKKRRYSRAQMPKSATQKNRSKQSARDHRSTGSESVAAFSSRPHQQPRQLTVEGRKDVRLSASTASTPRSFREQLARDVIETGRPRDACGCRCRYVNTCWAVKGFGWCQLIGSTVPRVDSKSIVTASCIGSSVAAPACASRPPPGWGAQRPESYAQGC